MSPLTSGYQWTSISGTAAGTTTIADRSCVLHSVLIPASATGTVTFHDSASGTVAKTLALVNDTVDFPTLLPLNIQMKKGIVAVLGGTVAMTAVWN